METSASGGTDVEVLTDLAVTGKPAQFGRGVMQDVSDKLLGQFVACLEQRLGPSAAADAPIVPDDVTGESGVSPPGTSGTIAGAERPPDPAPVPAPDAGTGSATPPSVADVAPEPVRPEVPRHVSPPTPPTVTPPPAPRADDAINLGSTVLPILLKTYWKQGVGLLAVIVLIVVLIVAL